MRHGRIYDIVEWDGTHYVTMEYVDGEDLSRLLRRIGRLAHDKAVDIARADAGRAAIRARGGGVPQVARRSEAGRCGRPRSLTLVRRTYLHIN